MYLADVNGTSVACNKPFLWRTQHYVSSSYVCFYTLVFVSILHIWFTKVLLYPVFIYALTLLRIYCAEVVKLRPWYACIMCFNLLKLIRSLNFKTPSQKFVIHTEKQKDTLGFAPYYTLQIWRVSFGIQSRLCAPGERHADRSCHQFCATYSIPKLWSCYTQMCVQSII